MGQAKAIQTETEVPSRTMGLFQCAPYGQKKGAIFMAKFKIEDVCTMGLCEDYVEARSHKEVMKWWIRQDGDKGIKGFYECEKGKERFEVTNEDTREKKYYRLKFSKEREKQLRQKTNYEQRRIPIGFFSLDEDVETISSIRMFDVKLPSMLWFEHGNVFTGSLLTDPGKGIMNCTTLDYRVQLLEKNEEKTFCAACRFRLPWTAKTNIDEYAVAYFEGSEKGKEIAANWISRQVFVPDAKAGDVLEARRRYEEMLIASFHNSDNRPEAEKVMCSYWQQQMTFLSFLIHFADPGDSTISYIFHIPMKMLPRKSLPTTLKENLFLRILV